MPWKISADLRYFRQKTLGKTVIMGRKTFESIGKPLDQRNNIILSKSGLSFPGAVSVDTPDKALKLAEQFGAELMVIGGAEIYKLFIEQAKFLYITHIDADFVGDAFFPAFNTDDFIQVEKNEGSEGNLKYFMALYKLAT